MVDDTTPQSEATPDTPEFDTSGLPDFGKLAENAENATPEEVAAAAKAAQTLLGKAKHFYEKAKRPPKVETPNPTASAHAEPDLEKRLGSLEEAENKRQFGSAHDLKADETDYLFAYAKGRGLDPVKALEDPFFKGGLETYRQQRRAESATPHPSGRQRVYNGKAFEKQTPEERAASWGK